MQPREHLVGLHLKNKKLLQQKEEISKFVGRFWILPQPRQISSTTTQPKTATFLLLVL